MTNKEKALKGLKCCTTAKGCYECPYAEDERRTVQCNLTVMRDAQEEIEQLIKVSDLAMAVIDKQTEYISTLSAYIRREKEENNGRTDKQSGARMEVDG